MSDRPRTATIPDYHMIAAIEKLTTGDATNRLTRRKNVGYDELREWDFQAQYPVAGVAGDALTYAPDVLVVSFDVSFAIASAQRDSQVFKPHFHCGWELITGIDVSGTAHVVRWAQDQNGTFTGAQVRWGCLTSPDHVGAPFTAYLHLNFQGYGAPPDIDESELADTLGAG